MSDLLAIFGPAGDHDEGLLESISRHRPDRVTVLVTDHEHELAWDDSGPGEALRTRLATLMSAIERDTGAEVIGLAGDRAQLEGWRFDWELETAEPVPA
jgi:hypothetical protein